MLGKIREKTGGKVAAIILSLVAIPFVLWGTYSYFEGGSRVNVARVGDVEIGAERYRSALEQQRRAAQQTLGKAYDTHLFDSPEFKTSVVEGMIEEVVLLNGARAGGYRVSDAQLNRMIRQEPQLQRAGQFDPRLYEMLLRRTGVDARGFEARLRGDMIVRQAASGFSEGGLVSEREISAVLRLKEQRREAAYAQLKPEKFLGGARITPQDIQSYYDAHSEQYRTPERARIQYLRLSAGDIARKIKLSDDELRKAYAEQAGRYVTPEQRRASHLLVNLPAAADPAAERQALAKSENLRAQALAGADFAGLARKHSEDAGSAANGGDLGVIERGAFPAEFESALSALKPGEISKPVRSASGYHLIKLTELRPEVRKSFTEARPALEKELRQHRADEQFFDLIERFRNLVYEQPDSLQPAAQALGLALETSDWFTRAAGAGIAAESKVREAAFDPEVVAHGRNSPAIEIDVGTVVALRVLEHQAAASRPLAEVRSAIEQELRLRHARAEVRKAGEALLARVRAGERLETLAGPQGASYSSAHWISRRDSRGPDAALIEAIFKAARPDSGQSVYGGVELANGGYAVYALTRVEEGNLERADDALKAEVRRLLTERRGREFYAAYRAALRQKADARIYADKL